MIRIGLLGFGRAGQAVATALMQDPRLKLCWVARSHEPDPSAVVPGTTIPIFGTSDVHIGDWMDLFPVDALVDFSRSESVYAYGEEVRKRKLMLINAVSHHEQSVLDYIAHIGTEAPVVCSPNITIGINFLMMAARFLKTVSPGVDIAIIEQHFRDKADISGTALRIAQELDLPPQAVTSHRLGGIVGHHEVVFGFPHQTLRISHDAIRREAFGTGAAFALIELSQRPPGVYAFEDLLSLRLREMLFPPS